MRDRWYKPPFCWVIRRDPLTMRARNMLPLPVKQTKFVPTSALYVESFLGVRTPYEQQWTEDAEPLLLVVSTVMIFTVPCILPALQPASLRMSDQVERESLSRQSVSSPRYVTEATLDHLVQPIHPLIIT